MAEAEKTKNLCAQIPESLHTQVRQRQEKSGKSLSEYMTDLIKKFFEMEEKKMAKSDTRTVAFQVDAELFERFKEYLKANGIKQSAFFIDCIQKALGESTENA